MGTSVYAVVVESPRCESPLREVAAALGELGALAPKENAITIHLAAAHVSGFNLVWCTLPDNRIGDVTDEIVAQLLSRPFGRAVAVFYSDSLGEAGYIVFENGIENKRNESPIPQACPLYERFAEGLHLAFPGIPIESPEDALDIFYGFESEIAQFVIARCGEPLSPPELAPPKPPTRTPESVIDLLNRWLKWPWRILKGSVIVFGAIMTGFILVVVVWGLIQLWWLGHS